MIQLLIGDVSLEAQPSSALRHLRSSKGRIEFVSDPLRLLLFLVSAGSALMEFPGDTGPICGQHDLALISPTLK